MEKIITFICLVCLCSFSFAQKTYFNVPSSEIVEAKQPFFQPQVNIADDVNAEAIFTYGLGRKLEAGLTIRDVSFSKKSGESPQKPSDITDMLVNVQKGFDIMEGVTLAAGTVTGCSYKTNLQNTRLVTFSFLNTNFSMFNSLQFSLGSYYANYMYAGEGTNLGMMAGTEIPLTPKINITVDYISGNSDISGINAGLGFNLFKSWHLTTGAIIPPPGSNNKIGLTVQLSSE